MSDKAHDSGKNMVDTVKPAGVEAVVVLIFGSSCKENDPFDIVIRGVVLRLSLIHISEPTRPY